MTWKLVHAFTYSAVDAARYRADVRTVAQDIAQDEPRNQVVLAGGDTADIAALGTVGGAAVNADSQSGRPDIMAGVFVSAPNTIAGKAVCRIVWLSYESQAGSPTISALFFQSALALFGSSA